MKIFQPLSLRVVVITCVMLLSNKAFTQPGDSMLAPIFANVRITLAPVNQIQVYLPFKVSSVIVKDNRPDTACIGLYDDDENKPLKLEMIDGKIIGDIFNEYMKADTAETKIYIVINHFFITNSPIHVDVVRNRGFLSNKSRSTGQLTYQAKIYVAQEGGYRGLVKIDTVISSKIAVEESFGDLATQALYITSFLIKEGLEDGRYVHRPLISATEVDSLNKPFAINPMTANAYSGYYVTYEDFKNNRLTPANFELSLIAKGCYYLYTKNKDNTQYLEHNVWGVKKGPQLYIMDNGLLFPVYIKNNAYYWNDRFDYYASERGIPLIFPSGGGLVGAGIEPVKEHIKIEYVPCLLNLQTGLKY